MKEFEAYDTMITSYYNSNSNKILPLSSWEFYGEYNATFFNFKNDLDNLRKITKRWDFDKDYQTVLIKERSVIVITDPDLKIVYVTHNIKKMSGYTQDEVLGRSPKMFQGKNTCQETSRSIRKLVTKQQPFEVSILNYRKDMSTYMCKIKGYPVYNKRGKLVNYLAFEKVA